MPSFRIHALQRDDVAYLDTVHLDFFNAIGRERQRLFPQHGPQIVPIADGVMNFASNSAYWSRTYGLGLKQEITAEDLDTLEYEFSRRGLDPCIEFNTLADISLMNQLIRRGYTVSEFTNALLRPFDPDETFAPPADGISIEIVDPADRKLFQLWCETFEAGFAADSEDSDTNTPEQMKVYRGSPEAKLYLARFNGEPAGGAVIAMLGEIGLMIGASTLPQFRRRGIQTALINRRFSDALAAGCEVATIYASQSSGSQHNAERLGFHIIYTQVCFRKKLAG
ncbi:GNAT family N-acetyltransferase [bacterium]|nr:GNAT family N-acetyltransferase [bacterium]